MNPPAVRPHLGISLHHGHGFVARNRRLVEEQAELFELTPETLWRQGAEPGAGHAEMLALLRALRRPVVGHGVLFSLGSAEPPSRRQQWLKALQRDAQAFDFAWFSEHLGHCDGGGLHATLPLPLPPGDDTVATVAAALQQLRAVHPVVAFENNADYFALGEPLQQPPLFAAICERADAFMVLDLHNAFTTCRDLDVDLDRWLDALPWERVLELHLSGGSDSDPDWLPSRRVLRLDSHDGAVPEPVWRAFAGALQRAPNLRAVILEWMPEGMTDADAAQFAADFARARRQLC